MFMYVPAFECTKLGIVPHLFKEVNPFGKLGSLYRQITVNSFHLAPKLSLCSVASSVHYLYTTAVVVKRTTL